MSSRRLPRAASAVAGAAVVLAAWALGAAADAQQPASDTGLAARARSVVAQRTGTLSVAGLSAPVEVLRDTWGMPHIYAQNTADLFFAQGFVVAQDRMWQLEMWRRNGEGKLAEVLGPEYVTRDTFARLLAFRGNWEEEYSRYHPEGRTIFESFARGVNASIRQALSSGKVPIEFELSGFMPSPDWTAQTVLTRMPGWTLSRNAAGEVARALQIKEMGVAKTEELRPTRPQKKIVVPEGLNLADIDAGILGLARGANSLSMGPEMPTASNNWVIDGTKSVTGMPILANDPHREITNPALRYAVHLVAPGWDAIGGTEPGLPGISIGHNRDIAWGFTILGTDQQDIYVEETNPANPNQYMFKGQWHDMEIEEQVVPVKGGQPVKISLRFTRHGPVLHSNAARHRAFALKWVGSEPGGAGYLGSLNVMQARNWKEFLAALPKAWFIPSHSLVYADTAGNIGYVGVAQTPIRSGWDGLLPVPGKDGKYEWNGYVPYDKLPTSYNSPQHFYNSSNNNVVPLIVPGYSTPLGYEYSEPYRYDRVFEVLSQPRKFSVADMERLQYDSLSIPARTMVPLLRTLKGTTPEVQRALTALNAWDFRVDRDSAAAAIYELWMLKLAPKAYAPRVPESARRSFQQYDVEQVIGWMTSPDAAYGADTAARNAARDAMLLAALEEAISDLTKRLGGEMTAWKWGDLHTADFVHPLARTEATRALFQVPPVRRSGDGFTVMRGSSPRPTSTKHVAGASFMFVMDVQDWDRSTGLSTPGNSAQPESPHYRNLADDWGNGRFFPLSFSRRKVEEHTADRLMLQPARQPSAGAREE